MFVRTARNKLIILCSGLLGILSIWVFFLSSCEPTTTSVPASTELKAAIIDQLYDIQPNQAFEESVTSVLTAYGFKTIDIYKGKDVDVSLYLRLPSLGYKLIILRVHSGLLYENGDVYQGSWLFTSEKCSQDLSHADQRLSKKIAKAQVNDFQPWVYAVGSQFISNSTQGKFDNSMVLAMGCYSFFQDDLAKAFISKGASAYIGWDTLVNLDYTDQATEMVIQNLCQKSVTLGSAIEKTAAYLGPEEPHESKLIFYPQMSGGQTLDIIIK
jgi:hypothetical protein